MYFTQYNGIKTFYSDTYDTLMRHEAQNVIPLGNIINAMKGLLDPADWFMATVSVADRIILTAVMTPPHRITLYATDNVYDESALHCLLDGIEQANVHVPGVMSEKALAMMFAKAFAARHNVEYKEGINLRLFELTYVNPEIPQTGAVRLAADKDMAFYPYWEEGFYGECFNGDFAVGGDAEVYHNNIARGHIYILEADGMPVSMAKITREMQTVACISGVYTPPCFRGRGYASACVAAVSQIILDKGYTKSVLFTDLANPTSNSIYMKIGYVPICDSLEIDFVADDSAVRSS